MSGAMLDRHLNPNYLSTLEKTDMIHPRLGKLSND